MNPTVPRQMEIYAPTQRDVIMPEWWGVKRRLHYTLLLIAGVIRDIPKMPRETPQDLYDALRRRIRRALCYRQGTNEWLADHQDQCCRMWRTKPYMRDALRKVGTQTRRCIEETYIREHTYELN